MTEISRVIDSKKYMWDGAQYDSEEEASGKKSEYEQNEFETILLQEDDKFLIYTRRVVTDVVVEGAPPI